MSQVAVKLSVDEVVAALLRDAGTIDLHGDEARFFVQTLRRLTEGKPLNAQDVEEIAASVGLTREQADNVLNWIAEKNDDGEIVGMAGLSQNQWNQKFRINGRDFTTWCALDTLYLPQVIGQAASVEAPDPATGEAVRFTLGPKGVDDAPEGAVISIVVPKIKEKGIESAEQIWTAFCSYSHYFTSVESGQKWFEGKHVEPIFLSIDEGHELGRKWFAQIIEYA
jgi:hypothetical protein